MAESDMSRVFSTAFPASEFKRRRQQIAAQIGPGASALLQSAPRRATAHASFVQSKVFFYLSGLELERCYLLIDGPSGESLLFVPEQQVTNVPAGTLGEPERMRIAGLAQMARVLPVTELPGHLEKVRTLYVMHSPDETSNCTRTGLMTSERLRGEDPLEQYSRRDEALVRHVKARFPRIEIANLDPILERMRRIKSRAEIDLLRKIGEMAAQALVEGMRACTPGMPFPGLQAITEYVYRLLGDCGPGYDFEAMPSTPGTPDLRDGDLVLVDCAPEYHHYTSDIARIWPVNGHFDAWQRHTYGVIASYHQTLLRLIAPGRRDDEIYKAAAEAMLKQYAGDEGGLAIIQNMIRRGVKYLNHHVGLSVHDAVGAWRDEPLAPGMVLVCDPMVWLDHAPHGYVRVEDTLVVTESGCERLTAAAPIEVDEIEALMSRPGRFPLSL